VDNSNSESRFKLDGNIESPKESVYLIDQLRKQVRSSSQKIRWLLVGIVLSLSLAAWLFFRWSNSEKELQASQVNSLKADIYFSTLDSLNNKLDSLFQENLQLQSDNDLLIENSDRLDGIFFEVLIGGFEDFNLERYLESISQIRKQEYDGSNRLVLGRFRSFKKALLFENDIKRIGLKDVLIIGRVEGQVVSFKEALEAVQKENN
jgi:hypothetical protein